MLKVAGEQGAKVIDSWFIGCNASLVVCEGANIQKYLGHAKTIVSVSSSICYCCRILMLSPEGVLPFVLILYENVQNLILNPM